MGGRQQERASVQERRVLIVSPGSQQDNNGNWRTAARWRQLLQPEWLVEQITLAEGAAVDHASASRAAILIALHARRSAAAIHEWHSARRGPIVVVLTGTDLYRDITEDPQARFSLACADRLVVLQAAGLDALPADLRERTCCIYQSTRERMALSSKPRRVLRAVMVGHLRAEKSPETLFASAALLHSDEGIRLDHVGAAIDPRLGTAALELMQDHAHYRWLAMQSHASTLRRIQRSHLLVHCSRMEGGAHAVMEAICGGTPVLASRIPGNIGMLGEDYEGYFTWGDAAALTALLRAARASQGQPDGILARLTAQCAQRKPLFAPAAERAALHRLLDGLSR